MSRPGDDDDRTLPDAQVPTGAKETFDDESPLAFAEQPRPVAVRRSAVPPPKSGPKPSIVPPLLRAMAPPASSKPAIPTLAPAPPPPEPPAPEESEVAPEQQVDLDDLVDPDQVILEWAQSLDAIDYLSLLSLAHDEPLSDERVRDAWRAFALAFHPDRHRDAPDDVRRAATHVFQRGGEAYRVLQDPTLRRRYLELLATEGSMRMSPRQVEWARQEGDGSSARDVARTPAARAFAEKADELLASGKLEAARLQLQLASMREPDNERLSRMLREVEQRIASSRPLR